MLRKYKFIQEERRNLSKGENLLDLMGKLYKAKAEGEMILFTLTARAYQSMCDYNYPVDGKMKVEYLGQFLETIKSFAVRRIFSKEWMVLDTYDESKTFIVREVKMQEIVYKYPPSGAEVIHYIIDG